MKKTKMTIATTALILTLTIGSIIAFLPAAYTNDNPVSTIPSNLLQYEWRQYAADSARSYFSAGPAPNSPSIKWKTKIPYVAGYPVAFNGMVFVSALNNVYALDGNTGDIVWQISPGESGPFGFGICKIDDNYMVIGSTCVKISDGTTVWTGPPGFVFALTMMSGTVYIPELKMFVDGTNGWSLPDPSKPPILAWNRPSGGNYVGIGNELVRAYGDGKLFLGGTIDNSLICVDALDGTTLWKTPSTGSFFYGASYVDGKLIHGELDNNMRAWDADTGELLWTYNPGTWYGQWASATGAAYGMIYEHNQDNYVYAINATTGELVWRAKGPGIGYSNTLAIADGKVYVQMGESQYRDFETGEYAYSEYDCFDAYTGELIWTLPLEIGAPCDQQCIAYGNIYVIPLTATPQEPGSWSYSMGGEMSLGEVWCISSEVADWSMYHCDPEHSAEGVGPTNLALKWKFKADASISSSATLVDGVCYFGTLRGTIYAIDANTATELWTFRTESWVKSTVAVVNGKLYTGADDGNIYCLDATTGNKLWETNAGGIKITSVDISFIGSIHSRSSPMVVGDRVYVGALDGNLYCLDTNSGNVIWEFQTGGPIQATPTIVDNEIYIPTSTPIPNGTLYKLDINGNVIWQKEFPYVLDKSIGSGMFLLASATVADGKVFLRNGVRLNYALDATTGETIWTYDGRFNPGYAFQSGGITQFMPMLYKYGKLYFNDFYGITCLNASNGTEIWHSWMSRENLAQGLSYSCQRIYTVTEFGVLYVLDALSGERLSYYEFVPFGNQLHSMPIPYNGNLYMGANDWNMYCFGEARLISSAEPAPEEPAPAQPIEPEPSEAPLITTEIAIIAAIAVAVIIGIAAYWILRKRK